MPIRVRPVIQIICPVCKIEYTRRKQDVASVIRKQGAWQCKACSNREKNEVVTAPIGSVRLHAQSGYLEEKTERGWIRQHIAVAERALGRRLAPNEVVHHMNEVKTDNAPVNLEPMPRGKHASLHHLGSSRTDEQRRRISEGRRKQIAQSRRKEI